jgi:ATP-dependent Clp protease adaptor protein ClpS
VSTVTETYVDSALADEISSAFDHLWAVVVHNDDVTTFETVITALVRLFGHSRDAAENLAWKVHQEGRAVVAVLEEAAAEAGVRSLHGYRIQASREPV